MVIGSRRMKLPSVGKMLGDYAEGDIVLLNESGSPVEFYVAKHDYEPELNGSGRTLLVRKAAHSKQVWDADGGSTYDGSDIDAWLNGDYKALLDKSVQNAIGVTKINMSAAASSILERSVFLLWSAELFSDGWKLPIADTLNLAPGGAFWLRTDGPMSGYAFFSYGQSGATYSTGSSKSAYNAVPCFTLPATAKFDPNTNEFKGVA